MTVLPPPGLDCASCAARDEVIAAQAEQIARQAADIAELRADVEALAAEVASLRRKAGRNSGNSSLPPSGDDQPGRSPPARSPKRGTGRRRGKQKGSPGASMGWAQPDEIIGHRPSGACGCGADLAGAADAGVARSHQQLEVPLA